MATSSDILITPATGYPYIDALLAAGPDWNFLTSNGSSFRTTLYYSFDTSGAQYEKRDLQGFNLAQQQATREALAYLSGITGIVFSEVPATAAADLHFATADITNSDLGGVCYANYNYTADASGKLTSYTADAYIYLDTVTTADPAPVAGSWWYQALLHELGHALGLKHPFESTSDMPTTLAAPYQDSTANTLMSYTHTTSAYYSQFNDYDLAALHFLYGTDGLQGAWGAGTNGLYLTGTAADSSFSLPQGRVILEDTGGVDSVVYGGSQNSYTLLPVQGTSWLHVLGMNTDHLISSSVEHLVFSDGVVPMTTLLKPAGRLIFGSDQADLLTGGAGDDLLFDFGGNDTLAGGWGNDRIYGNAGLDTACFEVSRQEATISRNGATWTVQDRTGSDTLEAIERLQFSDSMLALDLAPDQSAGKAALVVSALLGKQQLADLPLLGDLISLFDNGLGLQQFCSQVLTAGGDWLQAATGGTDAGMADLLFRNITGQQPPTAEQNPYLGLLAGYGGVLNQAELVAYAALSPENQESIGLTGLQQTGLPFL